MHKQDYYNQFLKKNNSNLAGVVYLTSRGESLLGRENHKFD